jgi:hypothetical protein
MEVDEDADVDGADGGEDAEEGNGGKLVDELDTDEDDDAENDQQDGSVHSVVVELGRWVHDVRSGNRHCCTNKVSLRRGNILLLRSSVSSYHRV